MAEGGRERGDAVSKVRSSEHRQSSELDPKTSLISPTDLDTKRYASAK
jgi:hypothetical protein